MRAPKSDGEAGGVVNPMVGAQAGGSESGPSCSADGVTPELGPMRDARGRLVAGHPKLPGQGRPLGSKDTVPRSACRNFRQMLAELYEGLDSDPPPGWESENPQQRWKTLNQLFFDMLRIELQSAEGGGLKAGKLFLEALQKFGPKGGTGKGGFRVILFGQGWDPMHRPGTPLVLRTNMGPGREHMTTVPNTNDMPSNRSAAREEDQMTNETSEDFVPMPDIPPSCWRCRGTGTLRAGRQDATTCDECLGQGTAEC
jgi:hypothetical protein